MQEHISMGCQICPRGCYLEATKEKDGDWVIVGNDCERGPVFMRTQLEDRQHEGEDSAAE